MKKMLFKSVNILLIGGGACKFYEITNRNISNFS